MPKEMTAGELAERSLITKYRKTIWNRFIGGCKDYELIKPGDRIAVCISGERTVCCWPNVCSICRSTAIFPLRWSTW